MKGYLSELRAFSRWLARARAAHASRRRLDHPRAADRLHPVRPHQPAGARDPAAPRRGAARVPGRATPRRAGRAAAQRRSSTSPRSRDVDYRLAAAARTGDSSISSSTPPTSPCWPASSTARSCSLLATTGLRVSSVASLARDALRDRLRRAPLPALPQPQAAPRSGAPDRRRRSSTSSRRQQDHLRRDLRPDGTDWLLPSPPARGAPGMAEAASRAARSQRASRRYVRKADIRDGDGQLASWVAPAPVPPPPRHQHGQRRRLAAGHPEAARPRLDRR